MTEHCPGSAKQADPMTALRRVTLPEIPTVYALDHPEDGVTAWVFVMPGGLAIIVPRDEDGSWTIHTSLDQVLSRRALMDDADLVLVTA
jgi:hypothetical protein